jgi:predicted Zn-dependent protease
MSWLALVLVAGLLAGIGCRTPQQADQEEFDRAVVARVRADYAIVADPAVSDYVREVGRPLAAGRGARNLRYRFLVLEDARDLSFSVGSGYVFVHTGALEAAPGTPEIAAMLAHEIAHVALGHELLERERDRGAAHRKGSKEERGMRALGSSREDVMRSIFVHRQWTLEQEQDADRLAVQLLADAGACPAALVALLERRADDARAPAPGAKPSRTVQRLEALRPEVARRGTCPPDAEDGLAAVKERILRGGGR